MNDAAPGRPAAWDALMKHGRSLAPVHLRELFAADPLRAREFSVELEGILFDYSRQRVDRRSLELLCGLARAADVEGERRRLFAGESLNVTEDRAVGHTSLRLPPERRSPEVAAVLARMGDLAGNLRRGELRGVSGQPIRHLLHLGIGGSDLGPRMAVAALEGHTPAPVAVHFVANVDPEDLARRLDALDPAATLVNVASKSFTTAETLANAGAARDWLRRGLGRPDVGLHLLAVTAAPERAVAWGVPPDRVLPFWEWVGGRFSLPSAVGFPLMVSLGSRGFEEFLAGMHAMDVHFRTAPMEGNLPVLMALLGVWNGNVLGARAHAVVTYSQALRWFPRYLQQLEMESNGKSVDRQGRPLERDSAPVIWGGVGTNAQHAFFQHLHQGPFTTPCDLIGCARPASGRSPERHRQLTANLLAQASALAFGRDAGETAAAGVSAEQLPWRTFPGNRPSSVLLLDRLTPFNLGRLVALYEHKVFVQGVIWNIFSFDQWGVELGKEIAAKVQARMENRGPDLDPATERLLEWISLAVD